MRVRVEKRGGSLALRIPRPLAVEAALEAGTEVDLSLEDGRLVVTPLVGRAIGLESLLARITPENLHGETGTGPSVGTETW